MANRRRYKDVERILAQILLGEAAVFVLYMIFAGLGVIALKVTTSIIIVIASVLCLAFLYMCGEMFKRRSRWLVFGFAALLLLLLVSLILNYPSPNAAKVAADALAAAGV
jgi:hypothetical protein